MKISLNWLKQYLDLPKSLSPEELALKLTMSTVEVEEVIDQREKYEKMIVGEITDIIDHPDADRLKVCKVKDGSGSRQVVCGGNNIYQGMKCVLALPGAKVRWHGEGEEITLGKTKIRGIESDGMICAADEVGLPFEYRSPAGGVVDLQTGKAGQDLAQALGLDDVIIDIDNKSVTHRPDLWGHYGIAREIAAIFGLKLKPLELEEIKEGDEVKLKIKVEDKENCSRYMGLVMTGLKVEPSPDWLKKLLVSVGVRPINNLVDITNYVMLEFGRPSHAFDRREVNGDTIIVRRAVSGEKFTTLDGVAREMTDKMTLVCDKERAIDLAGIMGGENSEIKDDTTEIILELANFNATNIRRTAGALNLRTEAAVRFEKSLAPSLAELGLKRIVTLIKQLVPSAEVASKLIDEDYEKEEKRLIDLDLEFLNKKIGQEIPKKEVVRILESLEFEIKDNKESLEVKVPDFRSAKDISIPEDLVEEVARIYGYDNLTPQMPLVNMTPPEDNKALRVKKDLHDVLSLALGSTETYNYSFTGQKNLDLLGLKSEDHLELKNYFSEEQKYLRLSLFENLLFNLPLNLRFYDQINLYELGRVYTQAQGEYPTDPGKKSYLNRQERFVCGVYFYKDQQQPFLKVKGLLETVLAYLRVDYQFQLGSKKDLPTFVDPERYLEIKAGESVLGWLAQLNKRVGEDLEAESGACLWQLNFELLVKHAQDKVKYQPLPKYPGMNYDFSIVVDYQAAWSEIRSEVMAISDIINRVELFDIFEDKKIGQDKKSLAFHVELLAEDKTLTSQEGEAVEKKIREVLQSKFKAEIR